jgi:hypothetical protein
VKDRRRLDRRIAVDEKFDEKESAAAAMRSLMPPDSSMDLEARQRMMGHLFSVQRSRVRSRQARKKPVARRALVPALAVVLVAAVLGAILVPVMFSGTSRKAVRKQRTATFLDLVGSVSVQTPRGGWKAAGAQDAPGEGWSVKTGPASTVSIRFPDGSIARLTDGSEARILLIGAGEVSVEHVRGSTYHRVNKGTKYTVTNSGVASHALGTAFNVENRVPGRLEILTIESAVEVSIGTHDPIKVSQGEVMTVSLAQDKKAEKQPVSRERLQDSRLMSSVQQDAEAGYSTGVYENLDVPASDQQQPAQTQPSQSPSIQLAGKIADSSMNLSWTMSGAADYENLVLLRTEGPEPTYPDNEISRYTDTSMASASDDTVQKGHTYQYRIAAVPKGSGEVIYSNTVVVDVPSPEPQPSPASVSLAAKPSSNGVTVDWSVSGTTTFNGFALERVVEKAPDGSSTPAGSTSFKKIDSDDVYYSYFDNSAQTGHTYSYRVGLIVNGAVMVYSDWVTVKRP